MNSDEGSDEDEEEGGWLAQKFDNPPVSARSRSEERRPLDPGGLAVSGSKCQELQYDLPLKKDPFGVPTRAPSSFPALAGFEDSFTFDVSHRTIKCQRSY